MAIDSANIFLEIWLSITMFHVPPPNTNFVQRNITSYKYHVVVVPGRSSAQRTTRTYRNPHPQAESFFCLGPGILNRQTDPISSAGNHGGSHWIPFSVGADPIYLLVFAADPISTLF